MYHRKDVGTVRTQPCNDDASEIVDEVLEQTCESLRMRNAPAFSIALQSFESFYTAC